MNIFIVTPNTKSKVTNCIYEALLKHNINTLKVGLADLSIDLSNPNVDNTDLFRHNFDGQEPDGIVCRGIGIKKTKKIFFRVDVFRALQFSGIPVINSPECLEIATNKMLTSVLLRNHGIHTPETIACESFKTAVQAFERLGKDILVKPMYGSKGVGITRLQDEGFAEYVFYNMARMDEPYYIQKYYEHNNTDIRAFVIGGQVIAAMERKSDNWKTNIAKGAKGTAIKLDAEAEEIAIKSTEIVKGEIAGVDLIKTETGYSVLEVNSIPGISGIQTATKIDIADKMAEFFIQRFKQ